LIPEALSISFVYNEKNRERLIQFEMELKGEREQQVKQ
jgi:hypothetical protein